VTCVTIWAIHALYFVIQLLSHEHMKSRDVIEITSS
jgi:hypothetical protein